MDEDLDILKIVQKLKFFDFVIKTITGPNSDKYQLLLEHTNRNVINLDSEAEDQNHENRIVENEIEIDLKKLSYVSFGDKQQNKGQTTKKLSRKMDEDIQYEITGVREQNAEAKSVGDQEEENTEDLNITRQMNSDEFEVKMKAFESQLEEHERNSLFLDQRDMENDNMPQTDRAQSIQVYQKRPFQNDGQNSDEDSFSI